MRVRAGLPAISLVLACGVLATASTTNEDAPVLTWAQVEEPVTGQVIQGEIRSHDMEGADQENRIIFVQPGSQSMEEMRARLADPEQRKAMRAEQRASLEQSHADVEEELKLDAATREALIELLTDQSMKSMDAMFGDTRREPWPSTRDIAEAENRKLDQLREVLGEEGLERYQEYTTTMYERRQVREVDAHLSAADKLSPEQKTRLVKLFKEKNEASIPPPSPSRMSNLLRSRDPGSPTFQQDMQRESQLATIEANEQILRLRDTANRVMTERTSGFLKPAQSAALAKVNEADMARQRKWIEQARAKAGLHPSIPARQNEESTPPRKAASGEVRLDLIVRVDGGEPVHVTHTGANGETLKFQASDDLFAEAEWTLYEDNWIDVRLHFFEEGPNGRRRLTGGAGFGTMGRISGDTPPGGNPFDARGSSSTIVTGRKAYSVELSASAEAR
jgi:hypothetical protein